MADGDRLRCATCFLKVYVIICDVLWRHFLNGPLLKVRRNSIAFLDFQFVENSPRLSANKFLMTPIILKRCSYVPLASFGFVFVRIKIYKVTFWQSCCFWCGPMWSSHARLGKRIAQGVASDVVLCGPLMLDLDKELHSFWRLLYFGWSGLCM